MYLFTWLWFTEDERPTMKNLNRYVTTRYATDWYDIGLELDLELDVLEIIKKDNPQQSITCFRKTLDKWLKLNGDNATWKALEVAITNVHRATLKLDPVDDVYIHSKKASLEHAYMHTYIHPHTYMYTHTQ